MTSTLCSKVGSNLDDIAMIDLPLFLYCLLYTNNISFRKSGSAFIEISDDVYQVLGLGT